MRLFLKPGLMFLALFGMVITATLSPFGLLAEDPSRDDYNPRSEYFQARRSLDDQEAVVNETITRGREQSLALLPIVRRDMEKLLETYGNAFSEQLRKTGKETLEELLESSELLADLRSQMLKRGHMAERLAEMAETPIDEEQTFDEFLAHSENEAIRAMILGQKLAQLDDQERIAFNATNAARVEHGLSPLDIDLALVNTARDHSNDMRVHNFFSHDSPIEGKATHVDRARRFGGSSHGENIFMGSQSGNVAVEAWMDSPGHRENILRPEYTRVGIGRSNRHWTQNFGR